jgi:hypothetical protein
MSAIPYKNTAGERISKMRQYGFREAGFKLDQKLSNPDIAVIFNPRTKELILSATGSRFGDKVHIKEVLSVVRRAVRKYPQYEPTLTGHSLGGYLSGAISRITGIPAIVFNRGSSPALEAKDKLARIFRKPKGEVIHYTTNKGTVIDPVSISAKLSGNDTKTISIDKTTSDISHSLSHFGAGKKNTKVCNNYKLLSEKDANILYRKIFNKIVKPMVGNKSTYQSDLEKAGAKLLGTKFKGVFPSDKIPRLNNLKSYAILNLDKSNMPGSHWVSIAHDKGTTYLYDSFGRHGTKIIPMLYHSGNGRIKNTDLDAEQVERETNCGARSLAWLLFFDKYGYKNAILI